MTVTGESKFKVHTYMGGVRITPRTSNPKVKPFVQVLLGGAKASIDGTLSASGGGVSFSESLSNSHTNSAVQAGAGVNVWASPRVGVRAGFDYRRVFGDSDNFGKVNTVRLALGIVIPVGPQ